MTKKTQETKEKIIEALEGIKEYEISYTEEVTYSKIFKAKSREELEDKWNNGELEFGRKDICEGSFIDGSFEIEEV